MAALVAALGALTALLCAVLLLRGWHTGRQRLLLWSGLCFLGLALSNGVLVLDLLDAARSFQTARLGISALAMGVLVLGLVWEAER